MAASNQSSSVLPETLKLIVFSLTQSGIKSLYLGAEINSVKKIINQTTIHSSGRTLAGVAHLDDQEVTIVDLHRSVFGTPIPQAAYLVILQQTGGELLGIPVEKSPALVEVFTKDVRVLPASYRQVDTLSIASHVTVAETEEGIQTIFLLDPVQMTNLLPRLAAR
jgi:chemotaxis signal transduction protein